MRWINDSKATNVGSTEAALDGLQVDGTLHLLLGGDGKSADFSGLTHFLQGDRIKVYCFGRDGGQLAALRPDVSQLTETMAQAMALVAKLCYPAIGCCCHLRVPAWINSAALSIVVMSLLVWQRS